MDFSEVIRVAQEATAIQTLAVDGLLYTDRQIYLPPKRKSLPTLRLNTLSGIVQYLSSINEDRIDPTFIHVENHKTVHLYSQLSAEYDDRHCVLTASADQYLTSFKFGSYIPVEQMIVSLKSCFDPTPDLELLVSIIGNLKEEKVSKFSDDGITQTVTARTGLGVIEDVKVPPRVALKPFRTFSEVAQPEGLFVFRMQASSKSGEPPNCALFEADGSAWKLTAIESIVTHLAEATINRFPIIS
jgi:hypothetical protein